MFFSVKFDNNPQPTALQIKLSCFRKILQ